MESFCLLYSRKPINLNIATLKLIFHKEGGTINSAVLELTAVEPASDISGIRGLEAIAKQAQPTTQKTMNWRFLLEEEYGWVFFEPSYTKEELPEPLKAYTEHPKLRPADKLYSGDVRVIRMAIEVLRHYLLETFITRDNFGTDHDERVRLLQRLGAWEWYKSISRFTTATQSVCLSMQQIISAFEDVLLQEHGSGEHPDPILSHVYNRLKAARDEWDIRSGHKLNSRLYKTFGFDEKVEIVRDLDAVVYRFLEILSQPVLAKSPALK